MVAWLQTTKIGWYVDWFGYMFSSMKIETFKLQQYIGDTLSELII